jgi:hypothetical protein
MKVSISNKAGFIASGAVQVNDNQGRPFYSFKKNGVFKFNLPRGVYSITGKVKQLQKPVEYIFKPSRKREHFHELPVNGELKIIYGNNPNKASIFPKKHVVIIDNQYKKAHPVVKDYLLFHEIGHYLYKTEKFADEFAQENLIKKGYPFSLIVKAAEKTLFNGHERHNFCYNNMRKTKEK